MRTPAPGLGRGLAAEADTAAELMALHVIPG